MPRAVRKIQQRKGETRRFLVSLHEDLSPLVILVTGAGKHSYYLWDLKVKWRHASRSPDILALGGTGRDPPSLSTSPTLLLRG